MASTATGRIAGDRALVGDGWGLDPLEPSGAAELYRRIDAAPPRRVPRRDLEGRTDLTARELYELGCRLRPLGLRGAGGMLGWRVAAVAGAVACMVSAAAAVAVIASGFGISDDHAPLGPDAGIGFAIFFAVTLVAGWSLLARAVRGVRRIAAARRRAGASSARPAGEDPQARAAATVLRGAGCLRVQLLWVRADVLDAACAEVRVLAERRVDEDDAGRAEDAAVAFSEIALGARSAHELRTRAGLAALGVRRAARHAAHPPSGARRRLAAPAAGGVPATTPDPRRPVPRGWSPDPLEDDGAAEVARRLCLARVERWSAEALSPLLVDRPVPVPAAAPPWPTGAARTRRRPVRLLRPLRWMAGVALTAAVLALASGDAGAPASDSARAIGYSALAVALLLLLARTAIARRVRGAPLLRAVRAAAARPPRGLEQGLPGMAGVPAVMDGVRDGRRTIALVHVRAAPDDERPGELELRTLAWRDLRPEEAGDPVEAIRNLWTVADSARARTASAQRSARALSRLLGALGRATGGERRPLHREPLAWVAWLAVLFLVAASVKHTIDGDWAPDGVFNRVLSYAWVLGTAALLWVTAHRINDPAAR
jgi:hypothetical protein